MEPAEFNGNALLTRESRESASKEAEGSVVCRRGDRVNDAASSPFLDRGRGQHCRKKSLVVDTAGG